MSYRKILAMLAVAALSFAACGSESSGDEGGNGAGAQGSADLAISAPADGAEVSLPFTIELDAAVPLGAPESGNDHVHVYYDGDDSEYEVVTSDSFQVTDLDPGDHTITASLRNADHSAAGTDVTIDVTVTGGEDGGGMNDSGGGGNKYGNSGKGSDDSGEGSDDSGSGGNYGY